MNNPNENYIDPEQNWPGDGSGMDDLQDMNANEASDYHDLAENEDYYSEIDTPLGDQYGGE